MLRILALVYLYSAASGLLMAGLDRVLGFERPQWERVDHAQATPADLVS